MLYTDSQHTDPRSSCDDDDDDDDDDDELFCGMEISKNTFSYITHLVAAPEYKRYLFF